MFNRRCVYVVAAVVLAVSGWAALAGEPTCDTLITSIPYTISAQGHYCLANNLATASTSGAAITVDANSVVLDLRAYKIGGQAAGIGTSATGVHVLNHSTVTIRNGLVRGFAKGIWFDSGSENNNNIVEDINADSNTVIGIFVGSGTNDTVRRCVVGNTGATTEPIPNTFGIQILAEQSFALDNVVTGTVPASAGTQYFGLYVGASGRAVNNQVIGDGATGNATNFCFFLGSGTIYKDNIASGCGTDYGGSGTPVGATNHP